jgi:membrane-associated phospholipid phosphatase
MSCYYGSIERVIVVHSILMFAVLTILLKGYSRVFEGEHWLGDVLAGYLSGALWLTMFIFLYQWATKFVERRRSKRVEMLSMS